MLENRLDVTRLLSAGAGLFRLLDLLLVKLNVVVLEVPLSEGGGVNFDDAVLDKGLGADELVVGGVVDDINDSGLASDGLGAPGEVTGVNTEGTVLHVATTAADEGDLLGTELGHGCLSTHFELSLLLVDGHTATGGSPLVSRIPRNTHSYYLINND